jgi:short-subunit dehydrogenase
MRLKKLNNRYFKGKYAIISGATSGIGRIFAVKLSKMGTNPCVSISIIYS